MPGLQGDRSFRPLAGERDKDLMDCFIPEPTHPRHTTRLLATCCLALFFGTVAWSAFVAPTTQDYAGSMAGLGWTELRNGVSWGTGLSRTGWSKPELSSESQSSGWSENSKGKQLDWDVGDMKPFDQATVDKVSRQLEDGTLFNYEWHDSMQGWNSTAQIGLAMSRRADGDDGRLIVLGDIHGMEASLKALLKRLAFNPQRDTLLVVGDLVAKSTVDTSLETVALLRRLGAKGVRGNHDQGVIQWRRWMEAYGPAQLAAKTQSGGEDESNSDDTEADTEGQDNDERSTNSRDTEIRRSVNSVAFKGARFRAKRGWWPFGGKEDTQQDEGTWEVAEEEADDEQGDEEEEAAGSDPAETTLDVAGTVTGSGNARSDTATHQSLSSSSSTSTQDDMTTTTTSSSSLSVTASTETSSSETSLPTEQPLRRPWRVPAPSSLSQSSQTSSSDAASSDAATSSSSDGSLIGPEWSWLTLKSRKTRKLNVHVPRKWEWGGEWFEIARRMSREDFEYLAKMPLTLHLDGLATHLVHAGMLPWNDVNAAVKATRESNAATSSIPASSMSRLHSNSALAFQPDSALSQRLSSTPASALLLVPQNTQPFTLLNMRTVKFGDKPTGKSHGEIGGEQALGSIITVSKGKKGVPWMDEWNRGMRECVNLNDPRLGPAGQKCVPEHIVFGHWAGRGLDVGKYSLGLDTGCVMGKRLSALVLYKEDGQHASPLKAQPGSSQDLLPHSSLSSSSLTTGTFRKFPAGGHEGIKDKGNPWGDVGGLRSGGHLTTRRVDRRGPRYEEHDGVLERARRVVRFGRRAPPVVRPGGVIDIGQVEEAMREQYQEAKAKADQADSDATIDKGGQDQSAENGEDGDGEAQDADTAAEDAEGQPEPASEGTTVEDEEDQATVDEDSFEEQSVKFAGGRDAWIVSVDCASEAAALNLHN